MSIETFEKLTSRFELYALLEKGLDDIDHGRVQPAADVFDRVEGRLRDE